LATSAWSDLLVQLDSRDFSISLAKASPSRAEGSAETAVVRAQLRLQNSPIEQAWSISNYRIGGNGDRTRNERVAAL